MAERQEKAAFRKALGSRMRAAAHAAGFTSDRLAEAMEVEGGTLRGWWVGRTEPSVGKLTRYAEMTKVSVDWLLHGEERAMGPSGTLQEWRLRFAELIRQGLDPLEAIDRITGSATVGETGIPDERLTPAEREVLAGSGPAMAAALEEASEGRWDRLTPEQREAVLRLIETMSPDEVEQES